MSNETQVPKAPPAPEVALRTLSTDAKSIAAGEVDPQPQLVTPPAPGTSNTKVVAGSAPTAPTDQTAEKAPKKPASTTKKIILVALVIILVLAIIAVVMFWLLPKFSSSGSSVEVALPTEGA